MNEEKQLSIYFNNGTTMRVAFPQQIKNSLGALLEATKRILECDKLVIQTAEQVFIVPWASVKYIEAVGVPASALPLGAIKGAQIIAKVNPT